MTTSPLRLSVFDRAGAPMDWIGAPLAVSAVRRRSAASDLVVTLDGDDEQVGVLTEPGARLRCDYLADPATGTWKHLVSGLVGERAGDSTEADVREFAVVDAWSVIMGLVAKPVPAAALSAQTAAYRTLSGPAETVLKTLVAEAATFAGLGVTMPANLGRGGPVEASLRFHHLADRLYPQLDTAGVVVDARLEGGAWWLDVRLVETYPTVLKQSSGVVVGGPWKVHPPTGTRVVVGGAGEGEDREWVLVVDTALEAAWGLSLPVVVDARDVDYGDTTTLTARGWQALAECGPAVSVNTQMSETDDFRFGVTFDVGDVLPLQLDGAPELTAAVTSVEVSWTADDGLLVVPHVGDDNTTFEGTVASTLALLASRVGDEARR